MFMICAQDFENVTKKYRRLNYDLLLFSIFVMLFGVDLILINPGVPAKS